MITLITILKPILAIIGIGLVALLGYGLVLCRYRQKTEDPDKPKFPKSWDANQ